MIKLKQKKGHKKSREKNLGQPGLTRVTRHPRHKIGIKKYILLKEEPNKKDPG
jgi:hypothetical protein